LLIETEMDLSGRASDTLLIDQQKSSTLPDLADHLPDTELVNSPVDSEDQTPQPHDMEVESGAHTVIFADSGSAQLGKPTSESPAVAYPDEPTAPDKSTAPGKATSLLPGVSGSQSEQPAPTTAFNQTRTTAPVESDSPEEGHPSDSHDELTDVYPRLVTNVAIDGLPVDKDREPTIPQGTSVLGSEAELRDTGSQLSAHRTVVFGSDLTEREDELVTTQWNAERPLERQEMMTAPFGIAPPPVDKEDATSATIIQQEARDLDAIAAQEVLPPDQSAEPSYRTNKEIPAAKIDDRAAIASPAPEKKRSSAVPISIAALVVLALAATAAWYFLSGSRGPAPQAQEPPVAEGQPAAPPAPPVVPQPPADKPPVPAAPEGMALVAGGAYIIGRDDGDPLERPRRTVTLRNFFIDRTEVTNADYKKFVDATGHKPPPNWGNGSYPEGKDNYPVTSVTWDDAAEYAAWAGKRLPTEAEWEAAARGTEGRIYPWGNQWQADFSNIGLSPKNLKASQYADDIKPVGEFPQGASAAGALDLIGNVWEWTADEFALYEGGIKKIPDDIASSIKPGKVYRVIRGGAFDGSKIHDATYRGLLDASQPYPKVGFRCAKDAPGGKQ
jgi:formylglycine-generating enzyme required for sulfatase activity